MDLELEINYDQSFTQETLKTLESQMKEYLPRLIYRRAYC